LWDFAPERPSCLSSAVISCDALPESNSGPDHLRRCHWMSKVWLWRSLICGRLSWAAQAAPPDEVECPLRRANRLGPAICEQMIWPRPVTGGAPEFPLCMSYACAEQIAFHWRQPHRGGRGFRASARP
jgi:hypothetical protein